MNASIPNPDSEDALEHATIDLLVELGWADWANCYINGRYTRDMQLPRLFSSELHMTQLGITTS